MKFFYSIVSLIVLTTLSFSQDGIVELNKKQHYFAASVNIPVFYKYYGQDGHFFPSVSIEYIRYRNPTNKTSYSLIYGKEIDYEDNWTRNVIGFEITKIFGRKHTFIEVGGGVSYNRNIDVHPRIGGRFNFGKHLLIKLAYTPRLRLEPELYTTFDHFATISFGYRFGFLKKK